MIIPLEDTLIIKANATGNHSQEIKRLQQKAVQHNVDQSIVQWLGSPASKKRKSKKVAKITLPGKIHRMFIEDSECVYEIAVDKANLLNVWISACQECKPWYKTFSFPQNESKER